jgi:hypothetical protein
LRIADLSVYKFVFTDDKTTLAVAARGTLAALMRHTGFYRNLVIWQGVPCLGATPAGRLSDGNLS